MAKILIVADDFGVSEKANLRIMECFDLGLISTASVMVTVPFFDEVVAWYHALEHKPKLGIHLDLDGGLAVSEAFTKNYGTPRLFFNSGRLSADERYLDAVETELKAQIQKMLDAGIPVDHIDSHHHVHTYFPISKIVLQLARKFKVPRVRVAGNILYPTAVQKKLYRYLINRYFFKRRNKRILVNHIPYFTSIDRFLMVPTDFEGYSIELMAHPEDDSDYEILKSEEFKKLIDQHELIAPLD